MRALDRLVSGTARRIGTWPLRLIGSRLRAEILENLAEEAVCTSTIPGGQIRFYAPSPLLISRAGSALSKETDTIRWIDGFGQGTVFWDVGANVGVFSLYAAIRKPVSVVSFEPLAANFHVLSRNIHLNQLDDRISAYCIAFSGQTQLGVLNIASPLMGASLSQFGQPGEMSRYWGGHAGAAHGMIGFTIDDFISQFDPPFPNYLKIDVDGLELPILAGARSTLRDPRMRSVLVELSLNRQDEHETAVQVLEEAGFSFVSRGAKQENSNESAANHVFEKAVSTPTRRVDSQDPQCDAESVDQTK